MRYLTQNDRTRRRALRSGEVPANLRRSLANAMVLSPVLRLRRVGTPGPRSPVRIRNLCTYTARSGSPLRPFRCSRIQFRSLAGAGLLPGLRKSSW
jgi:ribosomal protein S14